MTTSRPTAPGAQHEHDAPGSTIPRKRLITIFIGLLLGIMMAALDQTIVSTALPHIATDLNGLQQITWIITTYLLAQTIVMPVYGKVGDIIGRKRAFQIAIVIFLAGSVVAGLAQSMGMLIACRAVQGVGAGGLMIGAQTIIAEIVSARKRAKYMSIMGPMIGVATVLGPLLGGYLTQQVSWRWIFYINLPIGIAAMIITGVALKLPAHVRKSKVDYLGAALMAAGIASLVLVLTWGGRTYDWDSAVILGLIAAVVVLAALFLLVERRASEPILPLHLFRDEIFRINAPLAFVLGVAMFGAVSYLPTYLQLSTGASATMSGILLLPLMGGLMLAAVTTGQLISRTGRYKIFPIIGTVLAAVGMFLLSTMDADTSRLTSSLFMVVLGLGLGFVMPTLVLIVQNSVRREDVGSATAGINFFRQIGASFGTALIGSLFVGRLSTDLAKNLPPEFVAKLGGHATGVTHEELQKFPPHIADVFVHSYANALIPLYVYIVPVILIGFILVLFLKEKPLLNVVRKEPAADPSAGGGDSGPTEALDAPAPPAADGRESATAPGSRHRREETPR